MNTQDLQAMTLQDISSHITKRHGMELRRLAPVLVLMKDSEQRQRFDGVALFLAGSIQWTGKEAQVIRGELNKRLRTMDI